MSDLWLLLLVAGVGWLGWWLGIHWRRPSPPPLGWGPPLAIDVRVYGGETETARDVLRQETILTYPRPTGYSDLTYYIDAPLELTITGPIWITAATLTLEVDGFRQELRAPGVDNPMYVGSIATLPVGPDVHRRTGVR